MYGDAVGIDSNSRVERVMMEASSGHLAEDVPHSQDDTLKLIENTVITLQNEIGDNKDVSFATMSRRNVLGIQTIKNKMTLTYTCVSPDGDFWEVYEIRNAQIPLNWRDIGHALKVLEMLATVYLELYHQETVSQQLRREKSGIVAVGEEETVRSRMGM
ncbi:hypothetical protein HK104_004269 [Borealophlyctis nickersoniae]|nr:hypothetical protein HK104_004269 [Borealophlyctis nickersoniae]